ncbi:hypothetical protein FQR65_LT15970 [Abscondita terminalis]|nr:hypothetical protein FQR65_LT15970 [Abscondita terminalis]
MATNCERRMADLAYKNTKITEGHPLDDTDSTRTIWINAKEVEQNTGLYKLALDIYPELENMNGDFEVLEREDETALTKIKEIIENDDPIVQKRGEKVITKNIIIRGMDATTTNEDIVTALNKQGITTNIKIGDHRPNRNHTKTVTLKLQETDTEELLNNKSDVKLQY